MVLWIFIEQNKLKIINSKSSSFNSSTLSFACLFLALLFLVHSITDILLWGKFSLQDLGHFLQLIKLFQLLLTKLIEPWLLEVRRLSVLWFLKLSLSRQFLTLGSIFKPVKWWHDIILITSLIFHRCIELWNLVLSPFTIRWLRSIVLAESSDSWIELFFIVSSEVSFSRLSIVPVFIVRFPVLELTSWLVSISDSLIILEIIVFSSVVSAVVVKLSISSSVLSALIHILISSLLSLCSFRSVWSVLSPWWPIEFILSISPLWSFWSLWSIESIWSFFFSHTFSFSVEIFLSVISLSFLTIIQRSLFKLLIFINLLSSFILSIILSKLFLRFFVVDILLGHFNKLFAALFLKNVWWTLWKLFKCLLGLFSFGFFLRVWLWLGLGFGNLSIDIFQWYSTLLCFTHYLCFGWLSSFLSFFFFFGLGLILNKISLGSKSLKLFSSSSQIFGYAD